MPAHVAVLATVDLGSYAAILVVIGLAAAVAGGMLAAAHLVGVSRHGPVKDDTYESGVPPIGDARRRFNVRFYIVAMLFLLFDVEVVFLWPWAPVFHQAATGRLSNGEAGSVPSAGFLVAVMGVFLAILLVGYAYAWRKGVFRWD